MAKSTDDLLRKLETLRQENGRLQAVERELAVAIESLRNSDERLRLAVEAAHIGIWEWDIAANRVTWDAKKHDVFGLAHGSFAGTKEAFFEIVYPDDRASLQLAITKALDKAAPYQNEFRIVGPLGSTRWIANLGQVYRDDDGQPLRMIGVVYDVTDRHVAEAALRESEEKFRSIVEIAREWIWALDREGRLTYSNAAVEAILGYRPEELLGCSLRSLVHESDRQRVDETLSEALVNKRAWSAVVVRCRHKDATYRFLECHGAPTLDDMGQVIGFRGFDRDVSDRGQRRVVIVDDNDAVRAALLRLMKASELAAVAFPSAEVFLASDSLSGIGCLILDVQMPGMSGLQLQAHLLDRGVQIPIVFVTVDDHPVIRSQALARGAVRVIQKARAGNELLEAIEAALRR